MRWIPVILICCMLPGVLSAQESGEAKIMELTGTPWQLPSVTLLDGRLQVWSMDTLWLKTIEHISLFVAGAEFVAREFEFEPWFRWRNHMLREGNLLILSDRHLGPMQSFPLELWRLPDPLAEDSRLAAHARPDSLFITGRFEDGTWFFQFMVLGENDEYERTSLYIKSPHGSHWCEPPGMQDPCRTHLLPSTQDI